jgi:uncharacterized protein YbcI
MAGFEYAYRLDGGEPTVREFPNRDGRVSVGDLVSFRDGAIEPATTGNGALIGAARDVSETGHNGPVAFVVVDPDAVYAVGDTFARVSGAPLDITGSSGAQGVGPSVAAQLSVVADSGAEDVTLVRVSAGKYRAPPPEDSERHTGGELNAAIARAVVRYHREHLGRGPTKAQAFYRGSVIVVVLSDTLTRAERSLASAGRIDAVLEVRSAFQEAMRDDLAAAVEQLTGCRVIAFMSTNHVDPDLAAELFVLDRPVPGEAPDARPG